MQVIPVGATSLTAKLLWEEQKKILDLTYPIVEYEEESKESYNKRVLSRQKCFDALCIDIDFNDPIGRANLIKSILNFIEKPWEI